MQEQEGGRRGVGEKNKRRMGSGGRGTGGCELEKDGEKGSERNDGVCRVTLAGKRQRGDKRGRETERKRERERVEERETRRLEISRIFCPGVSAFNPRGYARRKVSRLRSAGDTTAEPSSFG